MKKKKRRLTNWLQNPSIVAKDLDTWKSNSIRSKINFEKAQLEESIWRESFYVARSCLNDSIIRYSEMNKKLKGNFEKLLTLTEAEATLNAFSARKKKNWYMRDILTELDDRQYAIDESIEEYESLLEELATLKDKNIRIPVINMSVEEVDEPIVVKSEYRTLVNNHKSSAFENDFENWEAKLLSSGGIRDVDIIFPYNEEYDESVKKIIPTTVVHETNESIQIERQESTFSYIDSNDNNITTSESSNSTSNQIITSNSEPIPKQQSSPKNVKNKVEDLYSVFSSMEESIRLNSFSKNDFDYFFTDRFESDNCLIDSIIDNVLSDREFSNGSKQSLESALIDKYKLLGKPFLLLQNESNWAQYINSYSDNILNQGTVTRKKKKSMESISISADPRVRTQRGIPLLFSPLSQYEDKVLGSIKTDPKYYNDIQSLVPMEIKLEEDLFMERCRIQSIIASAELKLKHLSTESIELNKMMTESENSLLQSTNILNQTMDDELEERKRIRKELVHYGIVTPNSDDVLLSPMNSSKPNYFFKNDGKKVTNNSGKTNKSRSSSNNKQVIRNVTIMESSKSLSQTDNYESSDDKNAKKNDDNNDTYIDVNNTISNSTDSPTTDDKPNNSPIDKKEVPNLKKREVLLSSRSTATTNKTQITSDNIIHSSKKRSCR